MITKHLEPAIQKLGIDVATLIPNFGSPEFPDLEKVFSQSIPNIDKDPEALAYLPDISRRYNGRIIYIGECSPRTGHKITQWLGHIGLTDSSTCPEYREVEAIQRDSICAPIATHGITMFIGRSAHQIGTINRLGTNRILFDPNNSTEFSQLPQSVTAVDSWDRIYNILALGAFPTESPEALLRDSQRRALVLAATT